MKIRIILAIGLWLGEISYVNGQTKNLIKLDTSTQEPTLVNVLDQIANQTDYTFSYSSTSIPVNEPLSLTKSKGTLEDILSDVFKNLPISYEIIDDQIVLKFSDLRQTVRGLILDVDSKQPVVGATIVLENSHPLKGTVTNLDGVFRLKSSRLNEWLENWKVVINSSMTSLEF